MNDCLVTILIPTYGRAHFVVDSVRSACAQTHRNLEILVLDDASPDQTSEALQPLLADTRLRYIRHEVNLGIAANWRYGLANARGDHLCILHDDDTLEPDFVEALLAPFGDDETLALVFSDHSAMDTRGVALPPDAVPRFGRDRLPSGRLSREDFANAVIVRHSIPVGATLFRRSAVPPDSIDDRAKGAIDYWLLSRVWKTGLGAYYVDRRLMNYRVHRGGMSARSALYMAEGHLYRYDAMRLDPQFAPWHSHVAAARCQTLTSYGIELLQAGRGREARRALWTALRQRPGLRAAVAWTLAHFGTLGRGALARLRSPG